MQVYIQVERTAETLNQCDGSGVCSGFGIASFLSNMRRDGSIDDTQGSWQTWCSVALLTGR